MRSESESSCKTVLSIVIGFVAAIIIFGLFSQFSQRVKNTEAYNTSDAAKFPVKRPKIITSPGAPVNIPAGPHINQPMKSSMMAPMGMSPMMNDAHSKEGWIVPIPSKTQMLKSPELPLGFTSHTSNPFMGGTQAAIANGVSSPWSNDTTLIGGNGKNNGVVASVWRTVI